MSCIIKTYINIRVYFYYFIIVYWFKYFHCIYTILSCV